MALNPELVYEPAPALCAFPTPHFSLCLFTLAERTVFGTLSKRAVRN